MECNIGKIDSIVRLVLGVFLFVFAVVNNNLIICAIAVVLVITGLLKKCPLYTLLKLNTTCTKE